MTDQEIIDRLRIVRSAAEYLCRRDEVEVLVEVLDAAITRLQTPAPTCATCKFRLKTDNMVDPECTADVDVIGGRIVNDRFGCIFHQPAAAQRAPALESIGSSMASSPIAASEAHAPTECPVQGVCDNPHCRARHTDPSRFWRIVRDQLTWYRDYQGADRGDLVLAEEAILAAARAQEREQDWEAGFYAGFYATESEFEDTKQERIDAYRSYRSSAEQDRRGDWRAPSRAGTFHPESTPHPPNLPEREDAVKGDHGE